MQTDFLMLRIKEVLESVAKNPVGYLVNIDGEFIKTSGGSYIATKIDTNNKVVFGSIQSVTIPNSSKTVNRLTASEDAMNIVQSKALRTHVNGRDYSKFIVPYKSMTVDFSPTFSCLVIKTGIYKTGYKLMNHSLPTAVLVVNGTQVEVSAAELAQFKMDFIDETVKVFGDNWTRYHNKLISALQKNPSKYPHTYTTIPNFRLMAFEYNTTDLDTARIVNPFLAIPSIANILKNSKMWDYMQENCVTLENNGDIIKCYFVSSIEFCRATNLKHHVIFPKAKLHSSNYYKLFFGMLYDKGFYSKNIKLYRCNDTEYLKFNPMSKSVITEDELRLLNPEDYQFYSPITVIDLVSMQMNNLINTKEPFRVKFNKVATMLSPLTLLSK